MNEEFSLAKDILILLRDMALLQFPAFPEAFGQLQLCPRTGMQAPLGTDGLCLFYEPELVCRCFRDTPDVLRRMYLHVHLHCLCGHVVQGYREDSELWGEACDLAAGLLEAKLNPSEASQAFLEKLLPFSEELSPSKEGTLSAGAFRLSEARMLLPVLKCCAGLRQIARDYAQDTHQFWFQADNTGGDSDARASGNTSASSAGGSITPCQLDFLEKIHKKWEIPINKIEKELSQKSGKHNKASGKGIEDAQLIKNSSIDYHRFLERFTIPREEAILDTESFDYIPYYLGLTTYGNMPFIEPLEYREVNRLDELAIAIDTSGSCSGRIVRRFLEETWNILRQKENFFSRMRLHLIQCDSMIQEHRIFTSIEDWESSLHQLRIHGFGDTDFRPVFEYLDKLIAQKEIRHLRGLLYFTDGDGIFPQRQPDYETAFVFLNQKLEKQEIPRWGIRLNLNLPEDF